MTANSDVEAWDNTESDDEKEIENNCSQVRDVLSAVSLFLVFYHLVYRISENAVNTIIGFIQALIHFFAVITTHPLMLQIAYAFPKTLHAVRAQNDYIEYVVCTKCCTLYNLSECIIDNHVHKESKKCSFIHFPNHPQTSRRKACNEILMKEVKIGKNYIFVPWKIYIYRSIIYALKDIAQQNGFFEKCEHWRD